jgi:eukaryotic-like serine/threonine-protein kinase
MAVVLWETIVGKRLFKGENDAALVAQVMAGAKVPPSAHAPGLPAGLDDLVMTGLAIEPAARFPSARAMADALQRLVPPSFPTEVAAWVEDLARDTLSQRSALLADIESERGVPSIPHPIVDEAPTIASQPSSMTAVTPTNRPARDWRSRPTIVAGALAVGVLIVAGIAFVRLASSQDGAASESAATGESPPSAQVTAIPAPSSSAPTLDPSASAATPHAAPAPRPAPAVRPSPATPRPSRPTSRPNCNPPFVIDGNGDRQYKPECL